MLRMSESPAGVTALMTMKGEIDVRNILSAIRECATPHDRRRSGVGGGVHRAARIVFGAIGVRLDGPASFPCALTSHSAGHHVRARTGALGRRACVPSRGEGGRTELFFRVG